MATGSEFTLRGERLTPAEQTVLKHLLTRASNDDIARLLGCSVKNVEFHVGNILKKAGEKSRLGLVLALLGNQRRSTPVPGRAPETRRRGARGSR
jgi:DNA-binding CsgD family transcriptional regulator